MNHARMSASVLALLLIGALLSAPLGAAERIEWWKSPRTQPVEADAPDADGEAGPTAVAAGPNRAAELLTDAAKRTRLPLVGPVSGATAEELAPPEADAEIAPPPIPDWATTEPFADYAMKSMAAAEYTHPAGQTLRAMLFELENSADAWGLWSRHRGERQVYVGQSAAFGGTLRVWEGNYTAVMAMDTPDEGLDEARLSKFARGLFALISSSGRPPSLAGRLPSGLQVEHTVVYFHEQAPFGGGSMALTGATEGAMAQYRLNDGATPYWGALVEYPSREEALVGWRRFVQVQLGVDPDDGEQGTRRTGFGAGWCGVKMNGSVCAYVLGAPTRNVTERLLAQAAAAAPTSSMY